MPVRSGLTPTLQAHRRAFGKGCGDQQECGRRRIAGNDDRRGRELRLAEQADRTAAARLLLNLDLGAELAEQPLGVVAGWLRLDHCGPTGRVQAGEQNRRLHLGRGDRQRVPDRQELGRAGDRERQPVATAR